MQCKTDGDHAATCASGKCEVVGSTEVCTQCRAGGVPVDGLCRPSSSPQAIAAGCTGDASAGVCEACSGGFFLFRGGCYDARAAPGSGVCREARGGACVGHAEMSKRRVFSCPSAASGRAPGTRRPARPSKRAPVAVRGLAAFGPREALLSRKRRLQNQLLGHARLRLLVRKWHIYSLATRPQQCEQESRATTPLAQTRVEEPGTGIVTRLRQKCVEQELEMHRLNLE